MSDIAIKVENVSKQYRLGTVGTGTISHDLNRWWHIVRGKEDPYLKIGETNDRTTKSDSGYVWALQDISFDVKQGEVLGIIGKNGAGKSTLLKILSRVTSPTTGTIRAKGRIGSLLEVGTGFHPEMTGRENIYMNGSIMGMTKAEITRKLDEIIDFAGVEKYIDTPTKRYSSGMTVRLGFAIAAHLEPEILIVDEVLAVGDAEFQKKAIGKMQDVSTGEGRTVLFVSHNMSAVENLCSRCIILGNGRIVNNCPTEEAIGYYLKSQEYRSQLDIDEIDRVGDGSLRIKSIHFLNLQKEEQDSFLVGQPMEISINFSMTPSFFNKRTSSIDIGINDIYGNRVIWLSTSLYQNKITASHNISFYIPALWLTQGKYNIDIYVGTESGPADYLCNILSFSVILGNLYPYSDKMPQAKRDHGYMISEFSILNDTINF